MKVFKVSSGHHTFSGCPSVLQNHCRTVIKDVLHLINCCNLALEWTRYWNVQCVVHNTMNNKQDGGHTVEVPLALCNYYTHTHTGARTHTCSPRTHTHIIKQTHRHIHAHTHYTHIGTHTLWANKSGSWFSTAPAGQRRFNKLQLAAPMRDHT